MLDLSNIKSQNDVLELEGKLVLEKYNLLGREVNKQVGKNRKVIASPDVISILLSAGYIDVNEKIFRMNKDLLCGFLIDRDAGWFKRNFGPTIEVYIHKSMTNDKGIEFHA